ncbi:MAG: ISAzo13 family transposase [Bacillota bacterium]
MVASKDPLLQIKKRYDAISPFLDEKQRRLFVAAEALSFGEGGITKVAQTLGVTSNTISKGIKELQNPETIETERIRKPGGGRKRTVDLDPTLRSDLEKLVEPTSRGEPDSPLKWTCKSTRKLAATLNQMGHYTSERMVCELLHEMGYSLQANRKTNEGSSHPDRNAQFEYINQTVQTFQKNGQPVISVDTKKKESVGDFKNAGQEWQPKNIPENVRVYDFVDKELGKVSPYGVYDMIQNNAWVNVGTDHDTAAFAVESIRGWWSSMGKETYPEAKCLLITADGGGSNGSRTKLWKTELQRLTNETGLSITVCHFPPGTSKWNKIEHRLFSYISQNWRGKPLVSHETVVNLISNTTTSKGLTVQAQLDQNEYPRGIKVTDEELAQVNLKKEPFLGQWNYTILPNYGQ